MDYRAFEQRLLDTIFTTDVQLNPATIAFLYKIPVQEASELLQQAAVQGLLNIESDDEGNLLYTYPNRIKLPPRGGAAGRPSSCPPKGVRPSSDQVLAHLRTYPAEARGRINMRTAIGDMFKKTWPCR